MSWEPAMQLSAISSSPGSFLTIVLSLFSLVLVGSALKCEIKESLQAQVFVPQSRKVLPCKALRESRCCHSLQHYLQYCGNISIFPGNMKDLKK